MNHFPPEDTQNWVCDSLMPSLFTEVTEPEAQQTLRTYVYEAAFFWKFLQPLLIERKPARAMEVGSGVGLLSLFASSEVEDITSLEPESAGFGTMSHYRSIILRAWQGEHRPAFRDQFLRDLPGKETFEFIYCINVLEHVPNFEGLIEEIYERLKPGGTAWFVLPNYSFPYEQHFGIPILFTKRISGILFSRRIRNHRHLPDPSGLWEDLSWPTQRRLQRFLTSRNWHHQFQKNVLGGYFERLDEPHFLQRKGVLFRSLRLLLKALRPVVVALPLGVAPIIEFTVSRPVGSQPKSAFPGS